MITGGLSVVRWDRSVLQNNIDKGGANEAQINNPLGYGHGHGGDVHRRIRAVIFRRPARDG
jgi:hypothetical protein